MSGFDDFFGGGTEQVSTLTDGQRAILDTVSGKIRHALDNAQGGAVYQGEIAPGATANQQAAFGAAGGLLGNAQGHVDTSQATQQYMDQMASRQPAYDINPEAREQFYQGSIYNPAKQSFNNTLQELDHRYRGFGQSGAQFGAASRAASEFEVGMGAQRGQLHMQDELRRQGLATDAANRHQQGVGAGIGLANQGNQIANQSRLGNLNMLGKFGAAERGIQGQQNAEDYYKWDAAQPINNPWLQQFFGGVMNTQALANVPKTGILDQVTGGLQGITGIAGGLF